MRKVITSLMAAAALAVPVSVASSAASPSTAHAALGGCVQWSIPAKTKVSQSGGFLMRIEFIKGNWWAAGFYHRNISAFEKYVFGKNDYSNLASVGPIFPRVKDGTLSFTINWNNGSSGVYTGTIGSDGRVSGVTVDRNNRKSRAYWTMDGRAKCVRYGKTLRRSAR
jgi:hypothetical protein